MYIKKVDKYYNNLSFKNSNNQLGNNPYKNIITNNQI